MALFDVLLPRALFPIVLPESDNYDVMESIVCVGLSLLSHG